MPRIHISLPSTILFTAEVQVRISDINYGGHVGNDSILTIMQDARLLFYRARGFKNEISFEGTIGQIIADASVQYKAESFLGDQLLVNVFVDDITKYGFDMLYQIINKENGKEIARGKTGIVCFDYQKRKVAPIPESVLAILS
jgi:acyl-CoA thioester hydrolase